MTVYKVTWYSGSLDGVRTVEGRDADHARDHVREWLFTTLGLYADSYDVKVLKQQARKALDE